jgi:hypothetical protein
MDDILFSGDTEQLFDDYDEEDEEEEEDEDGLKKKRKEDDAEDELGTDLPVLEDEEL